MNQTEQFILTFYQSINVFEPMHLSLNKITSALNIKLIYWSHTSAIAELKGRYCLFINKALNKCRQWQEFGHEIYHYLYDHVVYDRLHECYAGYGESKADYFAYHFCVPTFMLKNLKEVNANVVANTFNVEFDFALRRLEMYQSKMIMKGVLI